MNTKIKQYFQDYGKWFPEEWRWELKEGSENRERYMKYRARRSTYGRDNDIIPDFTSIEKDANRFDMHEASFTDIFGIVWSGSKGCFHNVGDADYEQHMYYFPEETDDDYIDEETAIVSEDVTADNVPAGYAQLKTSHGVNMFVLMEDITDIEYHYIVENHLFKDSYVTIAYGGKVYENVEKQQGNGVNNITVWDIEGMAVALKTFKPELYKKFLSQVDKHFKELQESKYENIREFAPTKKDGSFMTAEEYFDGFEKALIV